MEQNKPFRTAGFGGFHRQDVLDYIERTAKEQTEKREELTRQLEEAQAKSAQVTVLEGQLNAAWLELEQVKADRDTLESEKAELQRQLDQLLAEGQSVEQLKQQLADAKRQSEGYLLLKSDYAEIELDARKRASEQLSQANIQAEAIAAQAQEERDALIAQASQEADALLADARRQAEALTDQAQTQAETLLAQAQEELLHLREERRQLLARTRRDFDTSSADLSVSVTAALRNVEELRQTLLDLNTTFEENTRAVDDLCSEEV